MNKINKEAASKLSELNFKGINVAMTGIGKSAEEKIIKIFQKSIIIVI